MKLIYIFIIILIFIAGFYFFRFTSKPAQAPFDLSNQPNFMIITSPVFESNQNIPAKYTCDGDNVNPPLQISGIPTEAKSLVLIVDDPDAPTGIWSHWLVWNIEPSLTIIPENSVPTNSMQSKTSFGQNQYGGPCPPAGTHHYYFRIYALDTRLDLEPSTNRGQLLKAIADHILDSAELVGLYSR